MEDELLHLDVSYKRQRLIHSIYTVSKFFLFGAAFTALFDLVNAYKMMQMMSHIPDQANIRAQYWGGVVFNFLYAILLPVQAYFFYQFSLKIKNTELFGSSEELSFALRYLFWHVIAATILFGTNAIWAIIDIVLFYL